MEKSMKTKHGLSQLCNSLERAHTCSQMTRVKSPTSLKSSELHLIKAQNHIIKGKVIDNPSTIEQVCNILETIDTNNFEFGPKPFHVNSFTNMQKRQSQKLLLWLKSKLTQLKRTSQVTLQDYVQYKQSIVNIGLASVMSMVGTICKQLAEALGYLWSETFNMLEKIIDSSVKKQSQKDKLIMNQQIQLQKQKSLFVESVIRIQQEQTDNLKTLKLNFKDCIVTNRQLNKQIYRLNEELRGQHIKLQNIEYALIRSLDLNLENSHGEDLKWARMLLNSLFQNRKTAIPSKFVKPNRMLKYQQYTKFKVQHTIAQYLQTIKTYEMHSIDHIITNYLNIPSLDLKDINMPGLFLVPPQLNEFNKIKYEFTLQDIEKKPIREIFKTFKSVSVEVQTDRKQYQEKEIQTFPMTNLITKVTQTQKIYNFTSMNTQTDQIEKEITQQKPPIFFTQKEEQEPIKLKLITQQRKSSFFPRNSALLFKNQIETNNTSINIRHNQSAKISQKSIQSPFVSPRKNSLTNENKLEQIDEDIFHNDLKKRKFKQSALNPSTPITTKLRNTLTKIARVSTLVKPSRNTSLMPTAIKSLNQTDKFTPNISGIDNSLRSGDDQLISRFNRKQSQREQKYKEDLFEIKFINSEAILQLGQLQSGESSIDGEDQCLDIESHLKKLLKKPVKASSQILKRDPFCTQLKDQIFDYEIQNTNKIWQTVFKAAKAESFTIKNVSHKVLHLTRQFISIFSDIVKSKVFGNKFVSDSLNKKYCSSNLHPKYIFKPLQSLRSILINKLLIESKKKQEVQKSLKSLIGELLVLSQTKQMQIFVNLMGLGTQHSDSTELEILVRMMYFFNPSKPYGFSPDIIINFNSLKTHLPLIVDNILGQEVITNILKQFSQPASIIMLSQVFRSVCKQINQLKKQIFAKYKYITKYFPYPTVEDFKMLYEISLNFIKFKSRIEKKMIHFSDCYDKNHEKCLSEQKLWRLGSSCELPSQQQYLQQLSKIKIPKMHIYLFTKYYHQVKQKDSKNKNNTSLNKLINQLSKQNTPQEQKQHLHCLLYSVTLNDLCQNYIGPDLLILSEILPPM